MLRIATALLALYVSAAQAQMVYKCAAKGKPTSFQSEPCAPGTRTVKAVHAPPEPYRHPVYKPAPAIQPRNETVFYNNYQARPDERSQRRANCQSAKAQRARTLEQVGLSRTYDLLSQLDATVNNACKGL